MQTDKQYSAVRINGSKHFIMLDKFLKKEGINAEYAGCGENDRIYRILPEDVCKLPVDNSIPYVTTGINTFNIYPLEPALLEIFTPEQWNNI